MSLLEVRDLSIAFGGLKAVDGLNFSVEEGEVFTLVGPNGAGKSTVFNMISRFYQPTRGQIFYQGEEITHLPAHRIAELGIARTFQNIELFDHSTVLSNLLMGRHVHRKTRMLNHMGFLRRVREEEREHRHVVEEVISFLELEAHRNSLIAGLPYGVRKVVEIGRALAIGPKLLLLDEPASGLSVEETRDVAFWIEDMKREMGLTILMIEHDMGLVSAVSDRVLALADGRFLSQGTASEVQSDPAVIEAYLGSDVESPAAPAKEEVEA